MTRKTFVVIFTRAFLVSKQKIFALIPNASHVSLYFLGGGSHCHLKIMRVCLKILNLPLFTHTLLLRSFAILSSPSFFPSLTSFFPSSPFFLPSIFPLFLPFFASFRVSFPSLRPLILPPSFLPSFRPSFRPSFVPFLGAVGGFAGDFAGDAGSAIGGVAGGAGDFFSNAGTGISYVFVICSHFILSGANHHCHQIARQSLNHCQFFASTGSGITDAVGGIGSAIQGLF